MMRALGLMPKKKSGFKGSTAEERIVKQEKKIEELSRMLFAADLNIKEGHSFKSEESLKEQKKQLTEELDEAIDSLQDVTSVNRYHSFLDSLDSKDNQRRRRRGLEKA